MELLKMNKCVVAGMILGLVGCGSSGGSGEESDNVGEAASVLISGTAAAGAAIIGQVTVKGSSGNSISTPIETDGSYSVDVSSLVAPYMLRAEGRVGGKDYTLHSFAEEADLGGTVNITPFTDLIISNAASDIASDYFDNGNFSSLTSEEIDVQESALQQKLANVFNALGIDSAIDLLHTNFIADHSGLDAALDIIRIETDTNTLEATITNFIDNQSIVDTISDPDDNTEVLAVESVLSEAQVDLLAMANKVSALSTLFASSLPSSSQLESFFSEDTLDNDIGKSQLLTELSTDPSLVGMSFNNVTYEDYDQVNGTAIVQFYSTQNGVVDPEPIRWHMAKNDAAWEFSGNHEIADVWVNFNCNYNPASGTPGCGVNVGVEDNDFSNTPGDSGNPIASAKMSILRDGELVDNSEIYLGMPDGYSAGELVIYDEDYSDDYIGFGNAWSEIPASVFQAGDIAQIELFTEDLDISSAENPQIDSSATPVQTVTRLLFTAPVSEATVNLFPSVSAATINELTQYSGGSLVVEWIVPEGVIIEEVWLEARQGGNAVKVDDEDLSGDSGTASIALDTSTLNTTADDFAKELRIYGVNLSGQTYLTTYHVEGIEQEDEINENGHCDIAIAPSSPDPLISSETDLMPDNFTGIACTYYIDLIGGEVATKIPFRNGLQHGIQSFFDVEGNISRSQKEYNLGVLVYSQVYFSELSYRKHWYDEEGVEIKWCESLQGSPEECFETS